MKHRPRWSTLAVVSSILVAGLGTASADQPIYDVEIVRVAGGVPHLYADDLPSATYGFGYAFAQDNLCEMAETYVTVRARRAATFGATNSYASRGNGGNFNNLDSDFFFQRIIDTRVVETLLASQGTNKVDPELITGVDGYVAGYNKYLADSRANANPDGHSCINNAWVTPIDRMDAFRRFYQLILLASQGVAIDGITKAAPILTTPAAPTPPNYAAIRELGEKLPLGAIGSNAYGLGTNSLAAGATGAMVLGNPHFPWDGPERFYQAAFHVPGYEVAGASLFGVPLILIGHTQGLAWSHTVSTAYRFTPIELKLLPGDPFTYLVDGRPTKMTVDEVTIAGFGTRKLYSSIYGPILTEILGLPLFPWTTATAFAMADANADNFRAFNHFIETNRAQSTAELLEILKRHQGIPWVNTIAGDSQGWALYADIGSVPNVPDAKVQVCSTALGVATFQLLGLPTLDGSRSSCFWDNDPDAARKGIFGPSNMPYLRTKTYVTNSNDSYWLTNPNHPLEGFARIIGAEKTTRSLRTRLGLKIVEDALSGANNIGGRGFDSVDEVTDSVFNNRQYAGELWQAPLVAMCRSYQTIPTRNGPVANDGSACDALAGWDTHDDLASRGGILFRRFAGYAMAAPVPYVGPFTPFSTPFNVFDPVNTPRGLDTNNAQVIEALGLAMTDLQKAGIPFNARLGDWQYEKRGAVRVPIHGGPGGLGVFNAIAASWKGTAPDSGYSNVPHGSSFVMGAHLDGTACPPVRTILTYSLSTNPNSPYFGDQSTQYSAKQWNAEPCGRGAVNAASVATLHLVS